METILNHNIQQKENVKFGSFINLYQNIIRRKWKAHDDEITSLAIIPEPLSFASSSKDKLVKLWNFNCECIGAINTLPKLTRLDIHISPWKFKVNEEKILENEIAEVVRIFEAVGVDRIIVGSKEDTLITNDIKEEKTEKNYYYEENTHKDKQKKIEKIDRYKK